MSREIWSSNCHIGRILIKMQYGALTALLSLHYEPPGFYCFYGPSLCGKFMLKCCANRKEFMTIWQVGSIRITNNDKKDEGAILTDIPSNICYTTLQSRQMTSLIYYRWCLKVCHTKPSYVHKYSLDKSI